MKTIYVVTQENESFGSVRWFLAKHKRSAETMFNAYKEAIEPGDYIALFKMPVSSKLSNDEITVAADMEMWDVGPFYMNAIERVDARTSKCEHGPSFTLDRKEVA